MKLNYQKSTRQKSSGFTLVELLVVIAIIAVLAALATPMIMKAMVKTRILAATNICTSLGSAVDRFENDYSYLPFDPDDQSDDDYELKSNAEPGPSPIMAVLVGVEDEVNFKKIAYFTLDDPKGASGTYKDGMLVDKQGKTAELYDPWGGPYYMIFDYGLDDEIEHPFETPTKQLHGKKVLIYSSGPDGSEKGQPTSSSTAKELKLIPSNFLK